MQGIKTVRITADMDICGIFNFNQTGKIEKDRENHKFCKRDLGGTDYTSSRSLRHELFKAEQPSQPTKADHANFYPELAGSLVGVLRGVLATDTGCKRNSPLSVLDAYTKLDSLRTRETDEGAAGTKTTFYDQGSSSKPRETDLLNKKGKAAQDTSIFSVDNAASRKQEFKAALNISELQFLSLDATGYQVVTSKDEPRFVAALKKTFTSLACSSDVAVSEFRHATATISPAVRGIRLNAAQIRALVKNVVDRISTLEAFKAGSALSIHKESIKITVTDGMESRDYDLSTFLQAVPTLDFYECYLPAK